MQREKNILCFGAGSFLAKGFIEAYKKEYNIVKVSRMKANEDLFFDFDDENSIDGFTSKLHVTFDGVIFFQGINPSIGLYDLTYEHFLKMLKVNIIVPTLLIKQLIPKLNKDCCVLFFSSISKNKGSFDPSYSSAKAAITGLIHSLSNACKDVRFNSISLGLIEGSPVHLNMTKDFEKKHTERMYQQKLLKRDDVTRLINEVIINVGLNRSEISLDGGYN